MIEVVASANGGCAFPVAVGTLPRMFGKITSPMLPPAAHFTAPYSVRTATSGYGTPPRTLHLFSSPPTPW